MTKVFAAAAFIHFYSTLETNVMAHMQKSFDKIGKPQKPRLPAVEAATLQCFSHGGAQPRWSPGPRRGKKEGLRP